jgi:hypothetical protein
MRRAALEQASRFSWTRTARRLRDAVENATQSPTRHRDAPIALVPFPSRTDSGFDREGTVLFDQLTRLLRPVIFLDTERVADLPPWPLTAPWYERRLLPRIGPVVGATRILYVVDTLRSLTPLIDALRSQPGVVAFCNRRIAGWEDLVPEADGASELENRAAHIATGMAQVLGLATDVMCHSRWLYERLGDLARGGQVDRIHYVTEELGPDSPDKDRQTGRMTASFYGDILETSSHELRRPARKESALTCSLQRITASPADD